MGLIKQVKLSKLSQEKSIRFDLNYLEIGLLNNEQDYYTYKDLFEFVEYKRLNISELDEFEYAEIGNIDKNGNVFPVSLSYEDRNELNENYFSKIEKGDIVMPEEGNVLISSIRPNLNKNVLIGTNSCYFTKAMIQVKPKINSKLFYYLIRTIFYKNIIAVSRQGKGYPTLKEEDLKNIRFPKNVIDILLSQSDFIINQINIIEEEIRNLKLLKQIELEIINKVIAEEFLINIDEIYKIEQTYRMTLNLSNIANKNNSLRTSYRWNKLEIIQNKMYKDVNNIMRLGSYILKTNNGWSPECSEIEGGIPVLGMECLLKSGSISLESSKYTTVSRNNIDDFFIKEGDFFVSRGNTIQLVALAGVVENDIDDNIIYPDLYIKVEFEETKIDKRYIAYIFNSFIGRLYFKHVAKGKNQTMVKISAKELYEFYLPIPSLTQQQEIVNKIKIKIDTQKGIDFQIDDKQKSINKIIEQAISLSN